MNMMTVVMFSAKQTMMKPNAVNMEPTMMTTRLLNTAANAFAAGAEINIQNDDDNKWMIQRHE